MSISPQLHAYLDDLAKRKAAEEDRIRLVEEANRRAEKSVERLLADIDAAASKLDANHSDRKKWRPSDLIKIGYFAIVTSDTPNAEQRAMEFVREKLAA